MGHFFTADTHYGDDFIRRFFDRPFSSVAAMDEFMISANTVIGQDDDLWIIGDFAAVDKAGERAAAEAIVSRLPGRKHLVRGNHDTDWTCRHLPWASVHDIVELNCGGQEFVLCHYPLVTWNGFRDGAINLFGHVHTNWRGAEGQVNVGVDQWNFSPVSEAQAALEAMTLPPLPLRQMVENTRG